MDVRRCPSEKLEALFALRAHVWVQEGADPAAFPEGRWSDAHDPHRLHWIVEDNAGEVIAGASLALHGSLAEVDEAEAYAGRIVAPDGLVAAPARVVVEAAHRGVGLAQRLLDVQDEAARAADARLAVRQASPAMRRLLERPGWASRGPGPADARFVSDRVKFPTQ